MKCWQHLSLCCACHRTNSYRLHTGTAGGATQTPAVLYSAAAASSATTGGSSAHLADDLDEHGCVNDAFVWSNSIHSIVYCQQPSAVSAASTVVSLQQHSRDENSHSAAERREPLKKPANAGPIGKHRRKAIQDCRSAQRSHDNVGVCDDKNSTLQQSNLASHPSKDTDDNSAMNHQQQQRARTADCQTISCYNDCVDSANDNSSSNNNSSNNNSSNNNKLPTLSTTGTQTAPVDETGAHCTTTTPPPPAAKRNSIVGLKQQLSRVKQRLTSGASQRQPAAVNWHTSAAPQSRPRSCSVFDFRHLRSSPPPPAAAAPAVARSSTGQLQSAADERLSSCSGGGGQSSSSSCCCCSNRERWRVIRHQLDLDRPLSEHWSFLDDMAKSFQTVSASRPLATLANAIDEADSSTDEMGSRNSTSGSSRSGSRSRSGSSSRGGGSDVRGDSDQEEALAERKCREQPPAEMSTNGKSAAAESHHLWQDSTNCRASGNNGRQSDTDVRVLVERNNGEHGANGEHNDEPNGASYSGNTS